MKTILIFVATGLIAACAYTPTAKEAFPVKGTGITVECKPNSKMAQCRKP